MASLGESFYACVCVCACVRACVCACVCVCVRVWCLCEWLWVMVYNGVHMNYGLCVNGAGMRGSKQINIIHI